MTVMVRVLSERLRTPEVLGEREELTERIQWQTRRLTRVCLLEVVQVLAPGSKRQDRYNTTKPSNGL